MGFTPYFLKKSPYSAFLSADPKILLLAVFLTPGGPQNLIPIEEDRKQWKGRKKANTQGYFSLASVATPVILSASTTQPPPMAL